MTHDTMIRPPIKLQTKEEEEELKDRVEDYSEATGLRMSRAWGELVKIGINNAEELKEEE